MSTLRSREVPHALPRLHECLTTLLRRRPNRRWLVLVAVLLVALNLRTAITSLGALLGEVQATLGMSETVAGLLTALPVLCFGALGWTASALVRRTGASGVVLAGIVVMTAGETVRVFVSSTAIFLVASGFAFAGAALGNVLVPVLVKHHFPDRVGTMTGLYSMMLAGGTALAAATTVPLSHLLGQGWRGGLAVWAAAAGLAALPWLGLAWPRQRPHPRDGRYAADTGADTEASTPVRMRTYRSPTAWGLAVFFGMQGLAAYSIMGWLPRIYRDAGLSAQTAGLLLALAVSLPILISLLLPPLAARIRDQRPLVAGLACVAAAGYTGLAFAPATVPALWALLLGIGVNGAFPVALTMIALRVRTTRATVALSGFAQSIGYLLAALGPLAVGALYEVTGGWLVPLAALSVFLVPQLLGGLVAGRDRYVEDEMTRAAGGAHGLADEAGVPCDEPAA